MICTHIPNVSCYYSDSLDHILFKPSAHFEYQMILVTGGSSQVQINHKSYVLKEKSLLFISRLERHNFIIKQEPYTRYIASMSSELIMSSIKDVELCSIFIQRPKEFCHAIELSDQAYDTILPLFIHLAAEYKNQYDFYVSRSTSLVVAILIELYRMHPLYFPLRSQSNISAAVLNAQQYISSNFSQKVTLQEIADQNYISSHTLSIAFKDIVGITFKEYLLLFRITEAKKLLITTDQSISEIAEQVGYINVNNFIKVFREKVLISPLQYRKQYVSSQHE
ncbi:AraC family transcriptional regulator [Lacrimispora defluvii]|uniref:AraC family transcriptional regulator n=1 Tax=Lacrimispora defluvii TaxID=2719233 RepID=A0ABX1VSC7_9FIRM|nr:helix-turn-helix domain-containing protein [Lacrimispora defluvii]NNJ30915.1 AraC family transcriptional regulator [Lacrimispora defluvii]